jgi:hypothetical protein
MSFRIWTALGLTLALAACSNDNNNGKDPVDGGGSEGEDAGKQDAGNQDAANSEDDAMSPKEDAAAPSRLWRPALERPPTQGLPDSLKPPR